MSIDRRVFRYEVPVDDQPHVIALSRPPFEVAAVNVHYGMNAERMNVEFWAEHIVGTVKVNRTFQVFGTGQPLPPAAYWVATCPRTESGLVWHLYKIGPM